MLILVHGIGDTGALFAPWPLAGRAHLAPTLTGASVAELAGQLARLVQGEVDLVGFSLGALVARYYLQRLGGRARRFVSIAGPHQGSLTAYGLPTRLGRELRPGSALLRDLDGDWEATARQTPTTAIWTPFDLIVSPGWSGRLPGATAVRVPVRHGALLGHPRVQALALDLRA